MTEADVTHEADLADKTFWSRPLPERAAAFRQLRAREHPKFFIEFELPQLERPVGFYALVRHADVTEATRTPAVFSSARDMTWVPPEFSEYFTSMINLDNPRHARLRRIVSRAFSPRMVARFEDHARQTATEIIDDLLAAGPGDFVAQVAAPLPLKLICHSMGIPAEHFPTVLAHSSTIIPNFDPELLSDDPREAMDKQLIAARALADLVHDLAVTRAAAPGDDLTSALLTADIDGEKLTTAELVSFFILLVIAGSDTTRHALSHALLLLTEFDDQRQLLLSDLDGRLDGAIEEIVRCGSPVTGVERTLTRDYAMNGQEYRQGDRVLLSYYSANRDEAVFGDPERFDITRAPNPHVGFGGAGPHFCLGSHLARLELTIMLRELLTRVPDLTVGDPDLLRSSFTNGIKRLPCHFGGR